MCKNNPKIGDLPLVLQDLVLQFAYNMPREQVLDSLEVILDIKAMQLPFFFFKELIWSWHYASFLPNPIHCFTPIAYFGGTYLDLFDNDAFFCFLIGLDFRRKNVRCFGSRIHWLDRLCTTWKSVRPFSYFFKMLLRSETQIMKKRHSIVMCSI